MLTGLALALACTCTTVTVKMVKDRVFGTLCTCDRGVLLLTRVTRYGLVANVLSLLRILKRLLRRVRVPAKDLILDNLVIRPSNKNGPSPSMMGRL